MGLGDPLRLTLPLDLGVTVIAAHIASTGSTNGELNFERISGLMARYPNLLTDISALTQFTRSDRLLLALARPQFEGRLVYGSDWPLQFFPLVSPWYQFPALSVAQIKAIGEIDNKWDRDVALKEAMGTPSEVFARPAALLGVTP